MKFKTLIDKEGRFLALIDFFGPMEILVSTTPQLMQPTATKEDLEDSYPDVIDWNSAELKEVTLSVEQ